MRRKRTLILTAVVLAFLVLAAFFVWQKQESSDPCTSTVVTGKAEIVTKHPVTLLGDVVDMKVELRFCPEQVTVHKDSFTNLDVSPFDLRARSGVKERRDGAFTVWETTYQLQVLDVVPGAKYVAGSMVVSYEHNQLLKETRISSNPIFVGSMLSPDIRDVRPVSKETIKEERGISLAGAAAVVFGGATLVSLFGLLALVLARSRNAARLPHDVGEDPAVRFEAWWQGINSRGDLQRLYFFFRERELRGECAPERAAPLKEILIALEEAFRSESDVSAIKEKLKDTVRFCVQGEV